ncbi:hypothetical protein RhiirA1_399466 [Rhizophagus irregularis]|uniref:Uncharacterized protein n=1 Tax=Rhizophagus irregularis TaxID=588596 RepID=A0A2N0R9W4_9GLOM|nr:hypothetical protein RhiirA1_399466 [Rhizophagus irregularis]
MDILNASPIVNKYIHSGLIVQTKNRFQFTTPLMRSVLGIHLYSVPYDKRYHLLDDSSFKEFLLRSLERMRSSILRSSLSKASDKFDSHLVEQMWQNEWYRSANTVLPDDVTISSNVGGLYGTNACLDFYVNGELQWG